MTTGNQIVAEAKKFLGQGGSTFWKAYGMPAADWCAAFVWYVMKQAGASALYLDGQKSAWVPTVQEWLAKNCEKIPVKNAKPGDIVIFTWSGTSRDHIGFVVKKISDTVIQTIEGNTGSDSYNSSTVQVKERPASCVYGIYRPKYTEAKTVSYGEIRKYRCDQIAHVYKNHSIASGRTGADTVVGSTYSATKWVDEWIYVPYLKGWVPTKGSGGVYLVRRPKIRYVVTNPGGVNVYKDHSTKSMKLDNVICGAFLTVTKWWDKWGYAPAVSGWVAMSCLSEENLGTRLFRDCIINGNRLADAGVRYSQDSPPRTIEGAIRGKETDCAHYVSFALQDEEILSKGEYIWLDSGIHGTKQGVKEIATSDRVRVIRNYNKTAKEARLPFGAIAGYEYTVKGRKGQHTQLCAGYTSAGNPLWMSGGVSDVNGKNYGPKRKTTYEDRKINTLILPR